jgi:hypothetical protein
MALENGNNDGRRQIAVPVSTREVVATRVTGPSKELQEFIPKHLQGLEQSNIPGQRLARDIEDARRAVFNFLNEKTDIIGRGLHTIAQQLSAEELAKAHEVTGAFLQDAHANARDFVAYVNKRAEQIPAPRMDAVGFHALLRTGLPPIPAKVPAPAEDTVYERQEESVTELAAISGILSVEKDVKRQTFVPVAQPAVEADAVPGQPEDLMVGVHRLVNALTPRDLQQILIDIYGWDTEEDRNQQLATLLGYVAPAGTDVQVMTAAVEYIGSLLTEMAEHRMPDPYHQEGGALITWAVLPETMNHSVAGADPVGQIRKWSAGRVDSKPVYHPVDRPGTSVTPLGPQRIAGFDGVMQVYTHKGVSQEFRGRIGAPDDDVETDLERALTHASKGDTMEVYPFDGAEFTRSLRYLGTNGAEQLVVPVKNSDVKAIFFRDVNGMLQVKSDTGEFPADFRVFPDIRAELLRDPLQHLSLRGVEIQYKDAPKTPGIAGQNA